MKKISLATIFTFVITLAEAQNYIAPPEISLCDLETENVTVENFTDCGKLLVDQAEWILKRFRVVYKVGDDLIMRDSENNELPKGFLKDLPKIQTGSNIYIEHILLTNSEEDTLHSGILNFKLIDNQQESD